MCAIIADTDRHRFAIGSSSITTSHLNEIHLVSYSEDANRIDSDLVFTLSDENGELPGYEVSTISSSPYNRSTLVAAMAPAAATADSPNKIVFYQVQEREAPAILEESSPTADVNGEGGDVGAEEVKIQEISVNASSSLDLPS